MLTEKDYCDYETRKELIKLGYPAHLYDNTDVDKILGAILLYEVQKWLREEKGMLLQPTYLELSDEWICVIRDKNKRHGYSAQKQKNYEEALSEGIKDVVKILTNNKNE